MLRALATSSLRRVLPRAAAAVPARRASGSGALWGGRFSKNIDDRITGWADSTKCDAQMAVEDMWGSIAHVSMLGRQGIIPAKDAAAIVSTLRVFQDDFIAGKWALDTKREDVHLNVEGRLIDTLGMDVGGKMHTTRSRNDQVPLDSKLFTRRDLVTLRARTADAVQAFLDRAEGGFDDVMVLYTHVQHAQPGTVAFWLSHYASALLRDLTRLKQAYDVTDQNPLGGGAIAGTSFNTDRRLTSDLLGFQSIHEHSLDATGSRDFMLQVLMANCVLTTTTSRLAEEFILWSSHEFRTLTLDDGFAMGSSMMPQKKNPGSLELMRGRTGRMNGLLVAGLTMLKGLPSGYNRDFHEEKEILQRSLRMANATMSVVPALVETTKINKERMLELSFANFAAATELANFLVRKDVPFRQAHHIVGSLVGDLTRSGRDFSAFDVAHKHCVDAGVDCTLEDVKGALDSPQIVASYNSQGGTGPVAVRAMLDSMRDQLADHRAVIEADGTRLSSAYDACRALAAEAKGVTEQAAFDAVVEKHRATVRM